MGKLYFRYGVMGSSKTANALMTRFNYIEKNKTVLLLKPATDTRDGITKIKSRIGLEADAVVVNKDSSIFDIWNNENIIIVDECQFLTKNQIIQLRTIAAKYNTIVFCYGLRSDFKCNLFEGSEALLAVADEIQEIESICRCGKKATVNARFSNGHVITNGPQVKLGGNDLYEPLCYNCWLEEIDKAR